MMISGFYHETYKRCCRFILSGFNLRQGKAMLIYDTASYLLIISFSSLFLQLTLHSQTSPIQQITSPIYICLNDMHDYQYFQLYSLKQQLCKEMQKNQKPQNVHHQSVPQIIINADDYGYCYQRSKGILQLIQSKCVSSTTVIINAPYADELCGLLVEASCKGRNKSKENRTMLASDIQRGVEVGKSMKEVINWGNENEDELSIGLHINFTQFSPLSNKIVLKKVSIVEQETKNFKGKQYIYENLQQILEDPCLQPFLENEIHCQIQKFIEIFKQRPSHIDSHNHTHTIPKFAKIICKIARLYGIYKVRLPIPFSLSKSLNTKLDNFNNSLVQRTKQAKVIYQEHGFIFPDYFIGLDLIGKQLTLENIKKRIWSVCQAFSDNELHRIRIEIMVHPGYEQKQKFENYPTCSFSESQQRVKQLKTLKSLASSWPDLKLKSFQSLQQRRPEKSLIIFSKLLKSSGNLTTSLRLHQIFSRKLSYRVYFMNVSDDSQEQDQKYLDKMLRQLGGKCIVGVNLTRTAGVIHRVVNGKGRNKIGWKVPYMLLIAGTDANVTLVSGKKDVLSAINQSIKQCSCLISISAKLMEKVKSYLQNNSIDKQIKFIPQSSHSIQSPSSYVCNQTLNTTCLQALNNNFYILLPTSFRKIKSPHHILPEINSLLSKYPSLQCYIAGPIIDRQYYNKTVPLLNKVKYLECLPHEQYLKVLKNALVMINCSQSQGMSCAILEAFQMKVPVLVRKNQGNCQLVQDGENGFVYETGQQFIQIFQKLVGNYKEIRSKMCETAYAILQQKYSYENQSKQYIDLFNSQIEPLLYPLPIPHQNQTQAKAVAHILSLKNVHAVSPINLKIFNKFFQVDKNQVNPSLKYVAKIIAHLEHSESLSILDIGCGSGIFAIFFVLKIIEVFNYGHKIDIKLTFSDIHPDSLLNLNVNLKTLKQICYSNLNKSISITSIEVLESDMFLQLQPHSFNIILANMPQTPFKDNRSRLDKNGGEDGFKLTKQLLQNYQKYLKVNSTNQFNFLLILYSHILNQQKFKQIVNSNGSLIDWVSQQEVHCISRHDYDRMEERLAYLIEEKVKQGGVGAKMEGEVFIVPAQLKLLKKIIIE